MMSQFLRASASSVFVALCLFPSACTRAPNHLDTAAALAPAPATPTLTPPAAPPPQTSPQPTSPPKSEPGAPTTPSTPPVPPPAPLDELKKDLEREKAAQQMPETEPELLARIQAEFKRIPEDLRSNTRMPAETLNRIVDQLFEYCEAYNEKFPETPASAEVLYIYAKLTVMNEARYKAERGKLYQAPGSDSPGNPPLEWTQKVAHEYLARAERAALKALSLNPPPALKLKIEKVRGHAMFVENRFGPMIEHYRRLLKEFPDVDEAPEMLMSLIGAYEKNRSAIDGIAMCDLFLQKYPSSRFVPHAIDGKRKMLLWAGRPEEALAHMAKYDEFNRFGAKGEKIPGYDFQFTDSITRQDFATNLEQHDFFVGFANYVLGRAELAAAAFQKSIDFLDAKMKDNTIGQVGRVTLVQRTPRMRDAMAKLHGKPAPPIDLVKGRWLNDAVFDLKAELGNVVVLFFCPYKFGRSDDFSQALQEMLVENWSRGLRVAWLAVPQGNQTPEKQIALIQAEADRLGLTFPIALPLGEGTTFPLPMFEAYNVPIGTPTVVVIDRQGKVAWYHIDPTFRDFEVTRIVFDRLLTDKP
ncbi:MAG: hypothetical protein ACKVX7_03030 [Planctomycetota bacterium]